MGDVQEYFIEQKVRNFYSVSISGYHIAEAGANPITQLALTLSNGSNTSPVTPSHINPRPSFPSGASPWYAGRVFPL
jgi:hypothetical protein